MVWWLILYGMDSCKRHSISNLDIDRVHFHTFKYIYKLGSKTDNW